MPPMAALMVMILWCISDGHRFSQDVSMSVPVPMPELVGQREGEGREQSLPMWVFWSALCIRYVTTWPRHHVLFCPHKCAMEAV